MNRMRVHLPARCPGFRSWWWHEGVEVGVDLE